MLELLEEGGVDDGEAKADAAFAAEPDDAGLRPKNGFAVGERKADVEQAGKLHRFFQSIQSHAAGAEVHALDADFLTMLVLQSNGELDAGAEKFLLLEADESQRIRSPRRN